MKRITSIYSLLLAAMVIPVAVAAASAGITRNIDFHRAGADMRVAMELVLDSLELGANHQLFVTPVLHSGAADSARVVLPTVLLNGRNMHYAYERGSLRREIVDSYDLTAEVWRHNGSSQSVSYSETTPLRRWMYGPKAFLSIVYDTCGCGVPAGREIVKIPLGLIPQMRYTYLTPEVTELPVAIHEGEARVQFEVDRTELHPEPYTCRSGQRIDNREQLAIIYDSIRYATSDPNVEIARIDICGYASPESPYSVDSGGVGYVGACHIALDGGHAPFVEICEEGRLGLGEREKGVGTARFPFPCGEHHGMGHDIFVVHAEIGAP